MSGIGINWPSITQNGRHEPFELQVSRGQITNHIPVNVVGFSANIGTTEKSVWDGTGITPVPAAALQMSVSSSSASDAAAGTGARTVMVNGLDANYNMITEVVTLNGQTGVLTVNLFLRVNSMVVVSAGSSLTAAGTIYIGTGTITAGVPATVYNLIILGRNATSGAHYTIPAGYSAFVDHNGITVGVASGNNQVTTRLLFTGPNGIPITAGVIAMNNSSAQFTTSYANPTPEMTDIDVLAVSTAGVNSVSSYFSFVLIKNTDGI